MTHRSRGEEGQVYPALFLAVLGSLGIAVLFVAVQNLLDQTGRADTAADAAALAVGQNHRNWVMAAVDEFGSDDAGLHLGQILQLLREPVRAAGTDAAAAEYARANGADLAEPVTFRGVHDGRILYEVTTRQRDTVEGGDTATARSAGRATVAVEIGGGLCDDGVGLQVGAACVTPGLWVSECVAPDPPPPSGSPAPAPTPTPSPSPTPTEPPWEPENWCDLDLADLIRWEIYLVH